MPPIPPDSLNHTPIISLNAIQIATLNQWKLPHGKITYAESTLVLNFSCEALKSWEGQNKHSLVHGFGKDTKIT